MTLLEQLEAAGEVLSPAVRAAVKGLEATVALQEARIRDLEARLGLNSTNSSKPPSSDPPGVSRPAKKQTGKKRGGQHGHRGHHRSLLAPERVDEVVIHRPEECAHCGYCLEGAAKAKPAWVHQVVEMPPVRAEVTEHRMECVRCPRCRKTTRASLPAQLGGSHFGPRLVGLVGILIGRYRLSRRETADLISRLLDVPAPSLGSTEAFVQETSAALEPVYEAVLAGVRRSEAAGVDETPWGYQGKRKWLWVAAASQATVFHLGAGRGSDELRRFLGSEYSGVVNSDRWCAYQIYLRRQLCWAHLIRNFRKLALRGGKAVPFSEAGEAACTEVFKLWWALQEGRLKRDGLTKRIQPIRAQLQRLVRGGAESGDKRVAGFCRNLLKLWPSLWTFVVEPVEPTNNAAERAVRAAVLWRKGCFGSQSDAGMRYVERILTITATCRQQQVHPLDFVCRAITALRHSAPTPQLLTGG